MINKLIIFCLCMLVIVHGEVDEITLKGRINVRNVMTGMPTMTIRLNGGEKETLSRFDGGFELKKVKAPGDYSLEVGTVTHFFPLYTVQVSNKGKVKCFYHDEKGKKVQVAYPLRLESPGTPVYFEPRKQMNVLGMFMNPMFLLMGVMVLFMFCMPKMMENMDPEERKRMQEEMRRNQKDQPDPQKMLAGMFGGGGNTDLDSDSD